MVEGDPAIVVVVVVGCLKNQKNSKIANSHFRRKCPTSHSLNCDFMKILCTYSYFYLYVHCTYTVYINVIPNNFAFENLRMFLCSLTTSSKWKP